MIYDDFEGTTLDTIKWPVRTRPELTSVVSGRLRTSLGSNVSGPDYTRVGTGQTIDISDGWVGVHRVSSHPSIGIAVEHGISIIASNGESAHLFLAGPTTGITRMSGSSQTVVNIPTTHKYLRFRGQEGMVFFETSEDGSSWVTWREAPATIPLTDLRLEIFAGHYQAADMQQHFVDWESAYATNALVSVPEEPANLPWSVWDGSVLQPVELLGRYTGQGIEAGELYPSVSSVMPPIPEPVPFPDPEPDPDPEPVPDSTTFDTGLPRQVFSPESFWYAPLPEDAPLDSASTVKREFLIQKGIEHWGNASKGYPSFALNNYVNTPPIVVVNNTTPIVNGGAGMTLRDNGTGPYFNNLRTMFQGVRLPEDFVHDVGGSDGFLIVYNEDTDTYWDFWVVEKDALGWPGWSANRGQRIENASTKSGITEPYGSAEPYFYYGANAAGLAEVGGVIKLQELEEGIIRHVVNMAVPVSCVADKTTVGISAPATRSDGASLEPGAIQMGQRLRLPHDFDVDSPNYHPVTRTIARAFRDYGAIVMDRAGDISFRGENYTGIENGAARWNAVFDGAEPHDVMWDRNGYTPFPWESLQVLEPDYMVPATSDALSIAQNLGTVQSNPLTGVAFDTEWQGTPATYSNGLYTASHPVGASRYRSESYVSSDDQSGTGRRMQLYKGQRFVIEFDMRLAEGWRHPQPGNNVLWQLIGRSIRNYWPGPPVVLNYENLQYRIATSPNYPNASGQPIGSYEDRRINLGNDGIDTWHHWMVSVLLDSPGVGTIDAWCDGEHFAQDFKPGNGTWYEGGGDWSHLWVFPKVGIYGSAGTVEVNSPVAKVVEHKNLRATLHDTDGTVKTWRSPQIG